MRPSGKAATTQLTRLFSDVGALLRDEIDRLVICLRKAQPQFYADYRATRSIVDLRGRRSGSAETSPPAGTTSTTVAGAPSSAVPTPQASPSA